MIAPVKHKVNWTANPRRPHKEKILQDALGIPSLVACVLVNRGLEDPEQAHAFLHPSLDDLGAPEKLPDYEVARNEILKAKEQGDLIYVHGDYDVDGVTSAALLSRFLKSVGAKVETHVPHRMKEGYGIHHMAVDDAKQLGAKLFLTCDCGISAIEQIDAAKDAGMRVVVTDHHTLGESLPAAHALVNPHRPGSEYPFRDLSGVGVAFRLGEGLATELGFNRDKYRRAFLDLTVLGTVADVMPLLGENRIITRHGLKNLFETKKEGLRALMRESKLEETSNGALTSRDIGFVLGPRLNAAGRIDDAVRSLNLLMTSDPADAMRMARQIEEINRQRKDAMNQIVEEAVERVVAEGLHRNYAIVIAKEDWHPGIIGLVAGRLVEKFRRPAFVVTIDPRTGEARGSARSIPGFNLAEAIRAHPDLVKGGGHAMAAGFSARADQVPAIAKAFDAFAAEKLTEADFEVLMEVEAEIDSSELTTQSVEALALMEPYGQQNPEPIFSLKGMTLSQIEQTKNPLHPRVVLRRTDGVGRTMRAMAFGLGDQLRDIELGFEPELLVQARIEEWRGIRDIKCEIKHLTFPL